MPRVVVGEKLALEPRHVYADRALRLAGAALQTEVERVEHTLVPETGFPEPAGHREPEGIGPAAGRVRLVAGRHVRRTHRAVQGLAAGADAAAHLHGTSQPAVLAVVEEGNRFRRPVAGTVTEVRGERRGIDDLAWVEEVRGVEGPLDGAERRVKLRAEHPLDERSAHKSVTMLAGEGAPELEHQIGDVIGDRLELMYPGVGLQIDHRTHVQAPDRRVRIDAGRAAVPAHDVQKACDVVTQPLRCHRGVLDERHALGVSLHRHRQPERRLTQLPDASLGRRLEGT